MTNQIQARAVIQILNAPGVEIKVNLYVCGATSTYYLQTVMTTLQAVRPKVHSTKLLLSGQTRAGDAIHHTSSAVEGVVWFMILC